MNNLLKKQQQQQHSICLSFCKIDYGCCKVVWHFLVFVFVFFFLGTPELEDYNLGSWLLKSQLSFKLSPFYVRISFLFLFKWTEFASIWSLCIYMWISFTLYCLVNTMLYIFGYIFLLYNSSSSCYFEYLFFPIFSVLSYFSGSPMR